MTRLVFVGPHLGRHRGRVPSPAEDLLPLLEADGFEVRLSSQRLTTVARTWEHVRDLVAWRRWADVTVLSIFSGRSFLLAEFVSRLASFLGLTQVHVLHGGGLQELIDRSPERVRRVLGRADAVVAPSKWLADAVTPLGFSQDTGARVIPNVLDLARYDFMERTSFADPEMPRLLWMRTFHDIYQPELAVRVVARLREAGLGASLTMAGQDKGLEGPCRALAAELGVAEQIEFAGFLDSPGKRQAFSCHDVFLNSNRVDNTPVTVLEALASGLPVVATAVGGVPHLLRQGSAGRLVANVEPDVTAQAMADEVMALARGSDVSSGEPSMAELSRAGRRVAEECAWPAVRAAWQELFADLS